MTFSDYLLDTALVLLVVRQIRESRWDRRAVLLPLGITAAVAYSYLRTVPTTGNDLLLVAGLTGLGVVFGAVSALTTRVRGDGGTYALVRAGWIAAGTWVLSMGGRFAFAFWASHGGGPALVRFTVQHQLSGEVWVAALVLMALAEVVTRVGIVSYRAHRAVRSSVAPNAGELLTV